MILFQNAHQKLLARSIIGSEFNRDIGVSPRSPNNAKTSVKYESSQDEESDKQAIRKNRNNDSDKSEQTSEDLDKIDAKIASFQQIIHQQNKQVKQLKSKRKSIL